MYPSAAIASPDMKYPTSTHEGTVLVKISTSPMIQPINTTPVRTETGAVALGLNSVTAAATVADRAEMVLPREFEYVLSV
jgi:hypothetical protein